ncbi:MAG TPA: ATP-binding protein [Vitreimonas sp.]|nr:ATP-binding protein [Vitreimonas sp.]
MIIVGLRFDESVVGAPFAHDQALILLSVSVAAIATYAALELAERLRGAGTAAPIWHAASSIALGGGLWAMHAIAMLAFTTPLARGYDPGLAALSAFAAVAAAALAFWIIRAGVVRGRVGWLHLACAGAVLGLGLSAMLYTGVAALRVAGETIYRPSLFSLSVATSIAASIAVLWFAVLRTHWWQRALAAVAIAAAFCGLHYSAVAAAAIVAGEATTSGAIVASAPMIAGWIALAAGGGVMIALIGAFYDRRRETDAAYEAVRMRKEVAKRTVELQTSADQLDAARVAAERASAAKSDFLAGLSHELRTPLNSSLGFSQLLMNGRSFEPLDAKQLAAVQQIDQAGRHLVLLIDDILDLSRIEAGRLPLAVESVEAAALIDEAASMLQPSAIAANVTLHTDAAFRGLFVRADRRRLLQVLINLLSNGIKYNRQGGSVSVSCREADGEARISVSDTGAGIPAHRLDEVFEPFHRLGQDRSTITGSGVGLALCRRLIETMRGAIRVNSVEGKGSTFTVTLPLAAQTEWVEPNPPRATVLYIEDNPANVLLMRHIMKEMGDIELVVATTPREGIELARGLRPGLILLDINLPDMDGYEVLRTLRGDVYTADIPVFAVTSNALPKELERGVAAGFDHYLTKPLNIPQFVAAVEVALTQPPARRPKRVRIKPPAAPAPAPIEALAVKPPTPARKASFLTSLLSAARLPATPSRVADAAQSIPPAAE